MMRKMRSLKRRGHAEPGSLKRRGHAGVGGLKRLASAAAAFFLCLLVSAPATLSALPAFAAVEDNPANRVDPTQRADNSFIYDTTVASLFSQASLYNDRTVQVVGEVIGDRIAAGNGMYWITLTETAVEDKSTISVLMSAELANQIDRYGRYGVVGTTLQVRGTYHQACDEHDGLPDIHATNSSVLARGEDRPDAFDVKEFLPGIITVALGLVIMSVFYIARERTR